MTAQLDLGWAQQAQSSLVGVLGLTMLLSSGTGSGGTAEGPG
jgi:hypothetical protein